MRKRWIRNHGLKFKKLCDKTFEIVLQTEQRNINFVFFIKIFQIFRKKKGKTVAFLCSFYTFSKTKFHEKTLNNKNYQLINEFFFNLNNISIVRKNSINSNSLTLLTENIESHRKSKI